MTDDAARAIAYRLKWSMAAVRELLNDLEAAGVSVVFAPVSDEVCPNCGLHYATEETGFCVACTTERELERQRAADWEEEERLREEATRRVNAQKKQRQRMREEYGANPRKGREDDQ